jgi:hypothetical protein
VTRYRLTPEVVDLIGFCTKNPGPMLPMLDLLRPYGQYWFVTITPYGPDIEPRVPPKETVLSDFQKLSQALGPERVGWRYDPIFLSEEYPLERHISDFSQMAAALEGYTDTCVTSFIQLYEKVRRNFPQARQVSAQDKIRLVREFVRIGNQHHMTIKTCAEGTALAEYGADCSGCMTMETYEKALHRRLLRPKVQSTRPGCNCYLGCDIGQYDTCGHLCRYCYANSDSTAVSRNIQCHDPASPLLIGNLQPEDQVVDAKQESWLDPQLRLF